MRVLLQCGYLLGLYVAVLAGANISKEVDPISLATNSPINPPIPVQVPSPGLFLGNGSQAARVVLEAFIDLTCPDSADAWPQLQRLATHYTPDKVAVLIHQVPLPYHRNAMVTSQGLAAIEQLTKCQEVNYIDAMYNHNIFLSNAMTASLNDSQVLDLVADIAVTATKVDKAEFKKETDNFRTKVINSWKFAVNRGVAGTPWYAINGVDLAVNPGTLVSRDQWVQYIDGLLK